MGVDLAFLSCKHKAVWCLLDPQLLTPFGFAVLSLLPNRELLRFSRSVLGEQFSSQMIKTLGVCLAGSPFSPSFTPSLFSVAVDNAMYS